MDVFKKKVLNGSSKNIPIPGKEGFLKDFIHKTEAFISRMRWGAMFYLKKLKEKNEGIHVSSEDSESDEEFASEKMTYGFNTSRPSPHIKEIADFEKELWNIVDNIKFTNYKDEFQSNLSKELNEINKSNKVYMEADKTTNYYETSADNYNKLLDENVTSKYKKIDASIVDSINAEAKSLAKNLDLDDRIEALPKTDAFVTLKDHKPNFHLQPKCRLINPTKTEIGVISSKILKKINSEVRQKTKLQQWSNSSQTIKWFENIEDKNQCEFLQCDIVDFYPSISESLLEKALAFASKHTMVSQQDKKIIHHARKTILVSNEAVWCKNNNLFDVSMGAFDGAEIADLVGLLLLHEIREKLPRLNFGLYRDDGLAVYKSVRGIHVNKMKKDIHAIFASYGLRITAEFRCHAVNFLDVSFDLQANSYKPYRKPNDTPLYIHTHSNHPPHVIKQIPSMVQKRLSSISSSQENFDSAVGAYNEALRKSGFRNKLNFEPKDHITDNDAPNQDNTSLKTRFISTQEHEIDTNVSNSDETNLKTPFRSTQDRPSVDDNSDRSGTQHVGSQQTTHKRKSKRKRKRTFWYNPPFNKAVTTNIGKAFLALVDKHFGCERADKLHKLFNRHTVKLSYSCTPNMKTLIKAHNTKVLSKKKQENMAQNNERRHSEQTPPLCNCQRRNECPLQGKCQTKSVVYRATVTTENNTKTYIGSTEKTFKQRFYGHKSDMNNPAYRANTALAHYVWYMKDRGETPVVRWEIVRMCREYKTGTRKCDVCLTEKLMILKEKGPNSLNKRSELMYSCPHRRKYRLSNL